MSLPDVAPPRLCRVPAGAVANDSADAAFLATAYGLTPDGWQAENLSWWLGRSKSGLWVAATCGLAVPRQNGKNGIIEVRELYGMVVLGEKFLHTAHEVKTARKAFLRIASFFENERQYPELAALVKDIRKTNGQEAVILHNGGSVEFVARSRGSGRGFTVDVLVLDEAQDLTDEELAALLPTISAAPLGNPQVIFTGTPPDPEKPDKGAVWTRTRQSAVDNTDPALAFADYGIADGELPKDAKTNRALQKRHNPALGIRLSYREVEREARLMDLVEFARERLGWWGYGGGVADIFGPGRWAKCRLQGDDMPGSARLTIGVAVSIDRAWASIGAASPWEGRTVLGAVDRRAGTDWLEDEVVRIYHAHTADVVIDEGGPASYLIVPLERRGVVVTRAKTDDYLNACATLYDGVRAEVPEYGHQGHDELDTAVAGAAWRMVGDRKAWGRKQSSTDVSMLEAVTLAAWGSLNSYDVLDSIQ